MKRIACFLGATVVATALVPSTASAAANWQYIGGSMNPLRAPAVTKGTQNGRQRVNVYAVDDSNGLWNFEIDDATQTWTTTNLGGASYNALTALEWTDHREVYAVGTDGNFYRNISIADQPFGGWKKVLGPPPGTQICSDPSATTWAPGSRIDIYMTGCDGSLRHAWTSNGGTSWGWDNRGGTGIRVEPAPQAHAPATARLDVWVMDANNVIWDNEYNGSTYIWRKTDLPAVSWFASSELKPPFPSSQSAFLIGIAQSDAFNPFARAGRVVSVATGAGLGMKYPTPPDDIFPETQPILVRSDPTEMAMYVTDPTAYRVFRMRLRLDFPSIGPEWSSMTIGLWESAMLLEGRLAGIQGFPGTDPNKGFYVFGFAEGSGHYLVYSLDSVR
jgi:hypothetical protein